MRLVKEWLPVAVADGKNLVARAQMAVAASMGATAFQKGLGAIHSLSHPVGSIYDAHHGLTNAVFVPYVLVFNRKAIEDKAEPYGGTASLMMDMSALSKATPPAAPRPPSPACWATERQRPYISIAWLQSPS